MRNKTKERKQKIMKMMRMGLRVHEIASCLGITKSAVYWYIWNVIFKDGIDGDLLGVWYTNKATRFKFKKNEK